MSTLVYRYGIKRPPREIREQIAAQLRLAYEYRLRLWRLEIAKRAAYREARAQLHPELVRAEEQLVIAKELFELIDRKEQRREYQATKVEMQRLKALCRELREAAKSDPELVEISTDIEARRGVIQRALRKAFSRVHGLYWGTYLHVEAAAKSAAAGKDEPARPVWRGSEPDGDGCLAIQFHGGRSPADIHSGSEPSIRIERPTGTGDRRRSGGRTAAHYRLRSGPGGAAVTIPLQTMFDRDLPSDAQVMWAKLVVSRVHDHKFDYSLQLTVKTAEGARRGQGAGVGAVSFKGDRVTYACEYGEPEEFVFAARSEKIRDLQSIRDQRMNAAVGLLVGWCERQDETADWVREEISIIQERKSCRRLYHLRERLRGVVDERVTKYLDEWAYKENHLYWWQSDMRRSELLRRRQAFRDFAKSLRMRFRSLAIDGRRIDKSARMTDERRWLGLSELRTTLENAFGEDARKVSGDSCAELCERFRDAENAGVAREDEQQRKVAGFGGRTKGKRTGFARVHEAKKEAARNALGNAAE